MEGAQLRTGAVAGVSSVKHPVSLARAVMEHTEHGLLCGKGADAFAVQRGCEAATKDELVTQAAKEEWQRFKKYGKAVDGLFNKAGEGSEPPQQSGHDTVGAVCIDKTGLVAVATSTGGITAKMPGRVGDSPLIGCGAYADNAAGGSSSTGHGESIMKVVLTKRCVDLMQQGHNAKRAAQGALQYMQERVSGCGGLIAISRGPQIQVGIHFTTPRMPWAVAEVNPAGEGRLIEAGIDEPPANPIQVAHQAPRVPPLSVMGLCVTGACALAAMALRRRPCAQ